MVPNVRENAGLHIYDGLVQDLSPAGVRVAVEEGARQALGRRSAMRPFVIPAPIVMEIDTLRTSQADMIELIPGMRRIGGRTVSYKGADFASIYRALMAVIYLGATV